MTRLPLKVLLLAGAISLAGVVAGQAVTVPAGPAIRGAIGTLDGYVQLAQADDAALMAALMDEGRPLFGDNCAGCHGGQGEGRVGPSLVGHEFLTSASAVATIILTGTDPGHEFMPAFAPMLNDRQIAAIATFVRNSWGNAYGIVAEPIVASARAMAGGGGGE